MEKEMLKRDLEVAIRTKFGKNLQNANNNEIYYGLSQVVLNDIMDNWNNSKIAFNSVKQEHYLSAEVLLGRALSNNLINLKKFDEYKELLSELNININEVEDASKDAPSGNGGLGRLFACYIESAASMNLPVTGYGIFYSNGLFSQHLIDGKQIETEDSWNEAEKAWFIRKNDEAVIVNYADMQVKAVPYDFPVIGYDTKNISTLRLWKSEPLREFDFNKFNAQRYDEAVRDKNKAEDISRVLYPNDSNWEGKKLRLRQQYFFSAATVRDLLNKHKENHSNLCDLDKWHAIQLNDTHPTIAIAEFIRILVDEEGFNFDVALDVAKKVFNYTNHTLLAEALEKWDVELFRQLFPRILSIIEQINSKLEQEMRERGINNIYDIRIIKDGMVHMANLAVYVGSYVNGVAEIHSGLLKDVQMKQWNSIYPNKFTNVTNGVTQRRWLKLANQELSDLITETVGDESWIKDLTKLKVLQENIENKSFLNKLLYIKYEKKSQLADYIYEHENVKIDPNTMFDIQVKRMHEYKRQVLNLLYISDLYYTIKENPDLDIPRVTFLMGGKAFPGYEAAKTTVRFALALENLIKNDPVVSKKIQFHFMENYDVTYAQKIVPAADLNEQISTAGTEASGTSVEKFTLNGGVIIGTMDGVNIEIINQIGSSNAYVFGLDKSGVQYIQSTYNPMNYYFKNSNIRRALDILVNGDIGRNSDFDKLHHQLMTEDRYLVLADFESYKAVKNFALSEYKNREIWAKKMLMNIANCGKFSSDRSLMEYANNIWNIKPIEVK